MFDRGQSFDRFDLGQRYFDRGQSFDRFDRFDRGQSLTAVKDPLNVLTTVKV